MKNYVAKNMNKFNKFSIHKDKKYEEQFKLKCEDKEDLDSLNLKSNTSKDVVSNSK